MPSAAATAMKDIVGCEVQFANNKNVFLALSDLMAVVNGRSFPCDGVECFDGKVPCSKHLLSLANGGTPAFRSGKATVVHRWLNQNTGNGASHGCKFFAARTIYLWL